MCLTGSTVGEDYERYAGGGVSTKDLHDQMKDILDVWRYEQMVACWISAIAVREKHMTPVEITRAAIREARRTIRMLDKREL